jgi:hypothetical protein
MRGWCPRCDAVREADGTCPECQAPLVDLEQRPLPAAAIAERREAASEVAAEIQPPARSRLRVALAAAAVVLVGLAFVAGRSTGGAAAPPAGAAASTTTTSAPPTAELQHQLGWHSKPVGGISVEALSINRGLVDTGNGDSSGSDNSGLLTLRVNGLEPGRRLLAVSGLRLVDSGGGVFAEPETVQTDGGQAVPVKQSPQGDRYFIDLGPTPAVDTLDSIELGNLLLTATPSGRSRVELPTAGTWPARPPTRAVEPTASDVTVPVARGDGSSDQLPLRVAGAFVGAGRVVVVLSFQQGQAAGDLGTLPVTANLRAGRRLVCSRLSGFGPGGTQDSPMLVIDCPAKQAASLEVDLGAGIQSVQVGGKLTD